MKLKIVIIDYGLGNIKSLKNSIKSNEVNVEVSNNKSKILSADGIILPGVGAFSEGMKNFNKYNLKPVLDIYIDSNRPLLGICLGMQLLFESSEEFGFSKGIGYIEGKVEKLKRVVKMPHISWNGIAQKKIGWEDSILNEINSNTDFYFIHSFVPVPKNDLNILSVTSYYDQVFCSSVKKNNIYGTQFHPEKSGSQGLKIMLNFIKICKKFRDARK